MPRVFSSLLFALTLSACGDAALNFPITKVGQAQLDGITIIRLDQSYSGHADPLHSGHAVTNLPAVPRSEYRIGAGDVISIFVFDQPELAVPTGADTITTGYLVRSDGNLTFPFIGTVEARGRTAEDLHLELVRRLSEFFPEPQVDVRVAEFASQKVVVGGEVLTPNTQFVQTA